jgi:hypothetical protein
MNMKLTLIPTKKMTFRTPLSKQEVLERIKGQLATPENKKALHSFNGEMGESGFEIWEMAGRRNSFIPVIKAEVVPAETGTFIHIVMRMNGCAWTFVLVWCYPFALMGLLGIVTLIREGLGPVTREAVISILAIIAMPAIMITMSIMGLRDGIKSARAFILGTLGEVEEL